MNNCITPHLPESKYTISSYACWDLGRSPNTLPNESEVFKNIERDQPVEIEVGKHSENFKASKLTRTTKETRKTILRSRLKI